MMRDLQYELAPGADATFKTYIDRRRSMPFFSNARTVSAREFHIIFIKNKRLFVCHILLGSISFSFGLINLSFRCGAWFLWLPVAD